MGEADWWLCGTCQSLNNLSARKCYSCRTRKPRDAVRATDYLGYRPVESWDGRITMRMNEFPDAVTKENRGQLKPPPLRDPVLRDIQAVAPRPPHGARIEYREPSQISPPPLRPGVAPLGATRPVFAGWSGIVAPPISGGSQVLGHGHRSDRFGPAVRPDVRALVDPAETIAQHQAEQRSHWQDLLDVPTLQASRLRSTHAAADCGQDTVEATRPHDGLALHHAMKGIRHGESRRSRPSVIWPEADLAQSSQADATAPGDGWAISGRDTQPAT